MELRLEAECGAGFDDESFSCEYGSDVCHERHQSWPVMYALGVKCPVIIAGLKALGRVSGFRACV